MNGWEEAQIADMAAEDHQPDDDIWCSTDIECPFCGHPIDWKFDHLVCENCEVTWDDGAEVETDRRQLLARDEPAAPQNDDPAIGWADVFAEERGAVR